MTAITTTARINKVTVDLCKKDLDALLQRNLAPGTEVHITGERRMRIWVRSKGLVFGYEIHTNGKRIRKTIGTYGDISITNFKAEFQKVVGNIALHGITNTTTTVEQYFYDSVWKHSVLHHKNQEWIQQVFNRLSNDFKKAKIASIGRQDIEAEMQTIVNRGLSNSSANGTRALLSKMFNLAIGDNLVAKNPVNFTPKLYVQIKPAVAIADEIIGRYIELAINVPNQVHGLALALAALSGARIGEIRSLIVDDIANNYRSFVLKNTKNGDTRTVHVGPIAADLMEYALSLSTNDYLFSSDESVSGCMAYPRVTHQQIIQQLLQEGLIDKSFMIKDLRSSCGTRLFQQSGELENVRRQLGHRNAAVTAAYYLHPTAAHSQRLMENLDETLQLAHLNFNKETNNRTSLGAEK